VLGIGRQRIGLPNQYGLLGFLVGREDGVGPFAMQSPVIFGAFCNWYVTLDVKLFFLAPSGLFESQSQRSTLAVSFLGYKVTRELPDVLEIHLPEHDVMHQRAWSSDSIHFIPGTEPNMRHAQGYDLQTGDLEVGLHVCVHPVFINGICPSGIADGDWRMMADLLGDVSEVWRLELVGLSQDWIERLLQTIGSTAILSHIEDSHIDMSQSWIRALARFDEQFLVLQDLSGLLQHAYGLIERDWHGYLAQVLADGILEYRPY